MFCNTCGKPFTSNERFCANCGTALPNGPNGTAPGQAPGTVAQMQPGPSAAGYPGAVVPPDQGQASGFAPPPPPPPTWQGGQAPPAWQGGPQMSPPGQGGPQTPPGQTARTSGGMDKALASGQQMFEAVKGWTKFRQGLLLIGVAGVLHLIPIFRGVWGGPVHYVWWLLLLGFVTMWELGRVKISNVWLWAYGPLVATLLVWLESLTDLSASVGGITTLMVLAGSSLMLWDLGQRLRAHHWLPDWNRFLAVWGYRRLVLVGVLLCILSLWFTWVPFHSSYFWGWYYTSYSYWPSQTGVDQVGAVWLLLGLVAVGFWCGVPMEWLPNRFLRQLPVWVLGYMGLFLILHLNLQFGQFVYLVGAAAVTMGIVQLLKNNRPNGPLDLHEIPLERLPWFQQR